MTAKNLQERFGARCRGLRRKRKLSQMDMATVHGWDLSHYQKIERGSIDVKLSTMARLAKSYGITLAQMVRGL